MSKNASTDDPGDEWPPLAKFMTWSTDKIQPLVKNKTVVLSTGGTSRWYFLEFGDVSKGYSDPDIFRDYGRHVTRRVIEIADTLFSDGIQTVFIVGFGGGQGERNVEYEDNMQWVYEILIDQDAQALYDAFDMGVMFRGDWSGLFKQLGAPDLTDRFVELEQRTVPQRDRRLIWFVPDTLIPPSVLPSAIESLEKTGELPSRAKLSEAYYGRALDTADIFIGNNKPMLSGLCPPLMTVRDLYFTVSPITYLDRDRWRRILYDHLYSRRGHYRDYDALQPENIAEMRDFYHANLDSILGIGLYHAASQSWRPLSSRD